MSDREVAQELLRQPPSHPEEPRLLLVGIGGAGINMLRTVDAGAGLRKLALDTDDFTLALSHVERQLLLHTSPAGGTGGDPKMGRASADHSSREIQDLLEGDIVLLTAGLGRGTGTGVAPLVARLAGEKGLNVLAFLVWPFRGEGLDAFARGAMAEMRNACDGVLVLDNEAALSLPDVEGERDAAQLVNEMMGRLLLDLYDRVQEAFPFSVQEELADFLLGLQPENTNFPVRAAFWDRSWGAGKPLPVDPRGFVEFR